MQKEAYHIPWISVTLVLLAITTVGFFLQPDFSPTGALVYRDYGSGGYGGGYAGGDLFGYGGLSITAFYDQYRLYIDAIIFLLIFLSIGKAVFLSHFNSGGKSLYIAVGLALTLGLLLWEEQTGFSIIYNLGPVGIALLFFAAMGATYYGILKATGKHWTSILGILFMFWFITRIFRDLSDWMCGTFNWFIDCNNTFFFNLDLPPELLVGIIGFLIIGTLIFKGVKNALAGH